METAASRRILSVYCGAAGVTLLENLGERDFDLRAFGPKHAIFSFMTAVWRVAIRTVRIGVDHPDILHTEGQVVVDLFFQITRAIIRREHFNGNKRRCS